MRERDRLSLRAHREQVEAEERAERERAEAPIRAAQEQMNETFQKLADVYRDRLLGKVKDPDPITIDPSTNGVVMTREKAAEFNRAEFFKYRAAHPEMETIWLAGDGQLMDRLGNYFDVNGLGIITASMLSELVERFRQTGLLPDPPAPEPVPEPTPEVQPEPEPQPEMYEGRDPETGERKVYTKREVYLMSSEQYRKCFPILHTMAEVITGMRAAH